MAFVKLDTGILDSTLWIERECREVFITALLLAEPFETLEPMETYEIRNLNRADFVVPIGWYGFVRSAGVGILRRAMVPTEPGMIALEKLASADPESRSAEFEGRRMVRVDGGFIVLNFMKYRDRDYTTADRSRRYRERKKTHRDGRDATRDNTQAEAEAEAEKGKPKNKGAVAYLKLLTDLGVEEQVAKDWLAVRKAKRAPLTASALKAIDDEARKAGITVPEAIKICAERSWQGFKAAWLTEPKGAMSSTMQGVHSLQKMRDALK